MIPQISTNQQQIDVSQYSHVAIDAEWFWKWLLGGHEGEYITVQFGFSNATGEVELVVVFWRKGFKLPTISSVSGVPVIVIEVEDLGKTNLLDYFLMGKNIEVYMYYSPKDVQGMLGKELWKEMLGGKTLRGKKERKKVSKKRRLTIEVFNHNGTDVLVTDLIGVFNESLDDALKSVGINNPYKDLAKDKSKMGDFAKANPNNFLRYSVGDVLYLHKALIEKIKLINQIVEKSLGFNPNYEISGVNKVKLSQGSLVSDVFLKWLGFQYPDLLKASLMLSTSNSNQGWGLVKSIREKITTDIEPLENIEKLVKGAGDNIIHGLGSGSIKAFFPGNYEGATSVFGAVVLGGRCVNERPQENTIKYVLDIDLSSCYGSALRNFTYPIGLPTVESFDIDDEKMTLGKFLSKNENELIDGLYTIYVSGKLNFHQDLVHSKYELSTRSIGTQLLQGNFEPETDFSDGWGREVEAAHIKGNFVLTTKQIENGVITSEVLKTIKKVSTNQELNGWKNLQVVCAVYYPKSKKVSHEEFTSIMLDDKLRGAKTAKKDGRTRQWTGIKLEEFIGKFIDTRKFYKKQVKKKGDTYDLLQTAVKLFVNTTYGCLASPYFPMGNTVVANNITAKARTGVWMVAKALNTVESVTDGGMYSILEVYYLDENYHRFKKPSFDTLYLREKSKSLIKKSLIDVEVFQLLRGFLKKQQAWFDDRLGEYFDDIAKKHIDSFWNVYGLAMPFSIEHKVKNTGYKAAYFNSADYIIDTGVAEIIKVRGAKPDKHPKKQFLRALLNDTPLNKVEHYFLDSELIGVTDYQTSPHPELMPGDELDQPTTLKPRLNAGMLHTTYLEYKKAEDNHNRRVREYNRQNNGTSLEKFSKFYTLTTP